MAAPVFLYIYVQDTYFYYLYHSTDIYWEPETGASSYYSFLLLVFFYPCLRLSYIEKVVTAVVDVVVVAEAAAAAAAAAATATAAAAAAAAAAATAAAAAAVVVVVVELVAIAIE